MEIQPLSECHRLISIFRDGPFIGGPRSASVTQDEEGLPRDYK